MMRNLLSFFKKTPAKPENFIALDFGTTSTKAFIFSLEKEVQLLGQGQGTPAEAVEQAATQSGVKPTQAVVGLGGENVWCLTTTVRLNRPSPETEITSKEVEKLQEQIFRTALMQATPQMSQFLGDPELTLQLIDSETLYYKLDGKIYPPTSSLAPARFESPARKDLVSGGRSESGGGEVGRVLESSIFTCYSPSTYLSQLAKILKELNLNLWAVSSLMSLVVKALAVDSPRGYNAIVLDIGGKVTDVAVVFGGGIWGTRALSLGGETFTKAVSNEERKIAYATHQLRDEEVPKMAENLKPALDLFLTGVEAALSDFEGIKTFPRRIVLIGGGANLPGLEEGLSTYPLMRTLPFASPPTVEVRTDVGPQNMKLITQEILGGNDAT